MEGVINLIKQGAPANNNWTSLFDGLKSKTDVIVGAARNIENDQKLSLNSTSLLRILNNNSQVPEFTVGISVLLSIQGDNLPEGCHEMYFRVCKGFFSTANKEQALIAHKEG
jgi:hypothetical protein